MSNEQQQVRVLVLNEGDDKSGDLFRIRKGWIIQIVLSAQLSARKVRVFTDAVVKESDRFIRGTYRELKWVYPSAGKYDDSNRYVSVECCKPGAFHYYFTVDGATGNEHRSGQGNFIVEPHLVWPDGSGEVLEQDCISCQSVLSKSLGPIRDWAARLEVSYHSGYNMIHFTPLQKLYHVSNSSYAVTNHHVLNPLFQGDHADVKKVVDMMAKEWRILSVTDLVYNHAANDCALLKDHPEAAYNLVNSPHLKPAALLDSIFMQFTLDAGEGKLESRGIPAQIKDYHLQAIRHYFLDEQLPRYRLWEYYTADTESLVEEFRQQLKKTADCPVAPMVEDDYQIQLQHGKYNRMQTRVDLQLAEGVYYFKRWPSATTEEMLNEACTHLRDRLHFLNHLACEKLNEHLVRAVDNSLAACRYHFFAYDGPNYERLKMPDCPFVGNYFAYPNDEFKHPDEIDKLIENDIQYQSYVMAHNGWVMNDDPLRSFADEGQDVYLRRDLLQWSDIIKLRFGNKREDSPALYDYMKEYTRLVATTFHGCRLDNCHSTPLWIAQEMMDYARDINPDFYINAELFTGNMETDTRFINQIGINSMVRESLRAFDPYELGNIMSNFSGGDAIGSFIQPNVRPLTPSAPHAWLYDQTHDNPCPIERRSVQDVIPRSAVVAMASCSIGSNRGYDELVPHHIDVVHEVRFYPKWGLNAKESNNKTAIITVKRALNKLHVDLAKQGYTQLLVDQLSTAALIITRHNPVSHKSVIVVAHTAFFQPRDTWENINPLSIQGVIDEIILESSLTHDYAKEPIKSFVRSKEYINGLEHSQVYLAENLSIDKSKLVRLTTPNSPDFTGFRTIEFGKEFPPGSIIALSISLLPQNRQSSNVLRDGLAQFLSPDSQFNQIVKQLSLVDLERVLYRSSVEEQADGKGIDVYDIPGHGKMVYCGLQGQMSILEKIRLTSDLKHPLVNHLKQGNWLIEYIANRLRAHSNTKQLGDWYGNIFGHLGSMPRHMIPAYFDLFLTGSYTVLLEHGWSQMSKFVRQSSTFVRSLAQASIQLISVVPNARLPPLSPSLRDPRPAEDVDPQTFERIQVCPSLAAGFPHFGAGIWRNWGRDTFIALRGLLLLPGRYEEARYLLLSYGGCLRHGLIPNLLGDGRIARYNSRDAVWWWLHSLASYTQIVPDGYEILADKVSRLYPTHDSPMQQPGAHDQALYDVVHEVFLRHMQSLTFRERGAGHGLDSDMNDEGFNNRIGVDPKTGFVFGGNQWNCGTWMDKMGSSEHAGNKGHPATPRDGSAIELVALCRATLAWLVDMNKEGHYPYDSVETSTGSGAKVKLLFSEWVSRIDENFEREFWVGDTTKGHFINRRQIYKDTVNSTAQWTDYQFRPNFLVAAVVAPEMFDKDHIWAALKEAEFLLLGKFGMKTLDPVDLNYVGDYVNDDNSNDYKRARGFNYHNGPEWLWLTGYYLRAKLLWAQRQEDPATLKLTVRHAQATLSAHMELILANEWKGLPELTNANGRPCPYSCNVQAWSASTLIEALHDLNRLY